MNRFLNALEYAEGRQLHAEEFAYEHLKKMGVKTLEFPVRFQRIRASGKIKLRLRLRLRLKN